MTSPISLITEWIDAARAVEVEPDAMTLASASADGAPSARIVLCRGVDERGLSFFTNYESRKSGELTANPRAAVVFFWPVSKRQLRAEGTIERLTAAESDAYFQSRPRESQLGAWASPQSQVIGSLDEVQRRFEALSEEYAGRDVPRPPHWGGFRLVLVACEFWLNGEHRLHTRRAFRLNDGVWSQVALAP